MFEEFEEIINKFNKDIEEFIEKYKQDKEVKQW